MRPELWNLLFVLAGGLLALASAMAVPIPPSLSGRSREQYIKDFEKAMLHLRPASSRLLLKEKDESFHTRVRGLSELGIYC